MTNAVAASPDQNGLPPAPIQQNRYALLDPAVQAAEYEWWETACNVAWWVTLIGYTLLAVGVTVVVGITTPTYLPIATIAASFAMYPASNFAAQFTSQALAYDRLARIERHIEGIATELRAPNHNGNIVDHQIGGIVVPNEYRSLAGRYVYWKREEQYLMEESVAVPNRQNWLPLGRREDEFSPEEQRRLQQRLEDKRAQMPALEREMFDREVTRGKQTLAFQLKEEALRAKVYAAFCFGILGRADFPVELENRVRFCLPPLGANMEERVRERQMRLEQRGLSREFNAEPNDPLIIINRLRERDADEALSFDQVFAMTEEQLAERLVPAAG